jgi:hypothetical protein
MGSIFSLFTIDKNMISYAQYNEKVPLEDIVADKFLINLFVENYLDIEKLMVDTEYKYHIKKYLHYMEIHYGLDVLNKIDVFVFMVNNFPFCAVVNKNVVKTDNFSYKIMINI